MSLKNFKDVLKWRSAMTHRTLILAVFVLVVGACDGSSDTPRAQPDTMLDWDEGNWDEQDWQ